MKAIIQVFDDYQRARVSFVSTVAELATRPQNIDTLQQAGVMQLLRPLLLDTVPSIQQNAALALSRLANHSEELARAVVSNEILTQLVHSLADQNRFYKKAAASVLRAVAKHSPALAQCVVDSGAVESLVICLDEFDPGVKEAATWALGKIAGHTPELAQTIVDAGAVPLLVLCVQEPELPLKRIAASALSDICKHNPELAQAVVDAGAVAYLAPLIQNPDAKLKRMVCQCLGQICKHSVDLSDVVVGAEIFPRILTLLRDVDPYVRKNAATCIREIAKHTPELAQLIVNFGGVGALVEYVADAKGNNRLPGIMALGYIAAFSEALARTVISSKGIPPLVNALYNEMEDHIKAAAGWALGQVGRHSPEHAKALADEKVLEKLLFVYINGGDKSATSDDLRLKARRALKSVLDKCTDLQALQYLLHEAPPEILKYTLHQYAKVLPHDLAARREFVTSGGLQKVQMIQPAEGTKMKSYVDAINSCYPEDIVRFYQPGYAQALIDKIEQYQMPTL